MNFPSNEEIDDRSRKRHEQLNSSKIEALRLLDIVEASSQGEIKATVVLRFSALSDPMTPDVAIVISRDNLEAVGRTLCIRDEVWESKLDRIATYAHESWSRWMKYLFGQTIVTDEGRVLIPKDLVDRWMRQMNTSHGDLPDNEKQSDRIEAMKIIDVVG